MENVAVFILVFLLLLIVVLLVLLFMLLYRKWKDIEEESPLKPRDPKTFIRAIGFNAEKQRWQLQCRNSLVNTPDDFRRRMNLPDLPEIDRCETGETELAPPLVVRPKDVVVFDFTANAASEFAWVEFQFPEADLFVGQGGLPNSKDDFIIRVQPGQALAMTVRNRERCYGFQKESRFVYAMHVVNCENIDAATSPTGYVQGGSPPEIILEHG